MAKEIQCPLCGKKIIKKFFGKEHGDLCLGETFIFDCCRECCDKYKAFADKHGKTFSVKLKNLEDRTNQVLDSNERGQLFLQFYEEAQSPLKMARNYEKASDVMLNLGNKQKAINLLDKAQKLALKANDSEYADRISYQLKLL